MADMVESMKPSQGKMIQVTVEEAYMIKKQQALNIHFIPCEKIKQRFELGSSNSASQDID